MLKKNSEAILERFRRGRIAVIGDIMLDVYLWGQVTRISPEAPVPVVNIRERTCCPGGAANVMLNLARLGARASAFGAAGDDPAGREIAVLLREKTIDTAGIVTDRTRRTTEKRRVVAGSQQLLREDFEDRMDLDDQLRRLMVNRVVDAIRAGELDAVIFEDYAKGVLAAWMLEEIIGEARRHGVVTALDPKPGGVTPVKGLTVIKPNRSEAFSLSGVPDSGGVADPEHDSGLAAAAARLFELWEPDQLLISLAAQGMALYCRKSNKVRVIPTRAREVFDVSGAGDTVTATYTLALISGAKPKNAAEIANLAAGVVVGKMGTAPIGFDELAAAVRDFINQSSGEAEANDE